MDGQSPGVDFALIGHQDSWEKIARLLHAIRNPELERLSLAQIQDVFPWIPPRTVFHIYARSTFDGRVAKGAYIETFIPPDQLRAGFLNSLRKKVRQAGDCAVRAGAKIATLGGFTSIVLEGNLDLLPRQQGTAFTTGNTLTAAFIVKGVEAACAQHGRELARSRLLVIGSTGDIGRACVRYFTGRVRELLLCARRRPALAAQEQALRKAGTAATGATQLTNLLPRADIVISVASTPEPLFSLAQCLPHALICDAGYPKNILLSDPRDADRLWYGGMGQVLAGYDVVPDYAATFYDYPHEHVAHGCLLESFLLALERRYESYSTGRGKIDMARIEEIWQLARKHGFALAPFFNAFKTWEPPRTVTS